MKLLLTSGGFFNNTIKDTLKNLVEKPLNNCKAVFIPTAANLEEGDKWWLIKDLQDIKDLGFKSVDIVDISALPRKIWEKRLRDSDVIIVGGGNTYHLNSWINKSELKDILSELLKTRVYVGISAGSIVATPSLILSSAEQETLKEIGENVLIEGLSLVNFLVEPHINNNFFPELTFEYVEKKSKEIRYPIYAIDDNSSIQVIGGKVSVISEGEWKKFN